MNLTYVFSQGDPVLVTVFMILIGMSLISWYVIFWKLWKFRHERNLLNRYRSDHQKISEGCIGLLLNEAEKTDNKFSHLDSNKKERLLELHLSQTLDNIRVWLDRGLTILASVGSSAPFIGLFGTVWGVYIALTHIAAAGNASLNVVAGPMGEALVATAVGLFAAIPAVLAYNAFLRINRVLVQDLRHIAEQLTISNISSKADTNTIQNIKTAKGVR